MTSVEGAKAVRGEDAFDVAAVAEWLAGTVGIDGIPDIKQFSGGASNLTYLLRYPDRDLILRRPPAGQKAKSAHDMRREFHIQSQLKPAFGAVPAMIAFCDDESVIGSNFYVMERLDGTILRKNPPDGFDLSAEDTRTLCTNVIDQLIALHEIDPAEAGLLDIGKGEGYVGRQVKGWSDRYRTAKTWNVGSFEGVMRWLDANQPPDVRTCVIHNDFRFDNVVLDKQDPHRVVGILDWEMATLGDPLMDLGGALAYWVQADDNWIFRQFRRQPTHLPGMLTREEVVQYYCERTGLDITPREWAFYEVFGLFRLAVIAQQIFYRYHHKQTRNPAFRQLQYAVLALDWRCHHIIRAVSSPRSVDSAP
ncbi:MAG: phosphotransferase family protein [Nocardiaceae bacterium]|nr:phosphotransferase family protein [Nocardiaceae bacterium]